MDSQQFESHSDGHWCVPKRHRQVLRRRKLQRHCRESSIGNTEGKRAKTKSKENTLSEPILGKYGTSTTDSGAAIGRGSDVMSHRDGEKGRRLVLVGLKRHKDGHVLGKHRGSI